MPQNHPSNRPEGYGVYQIDRKAALERVADILEANPEMIKGYFVVSLNIDNSMSIAHDACCIPHMIELLMSAVEDYPELAVPRLGPNAAHPA